MMTMVNGSVAYLLFYKPNINPGITNKCQFAGKEHDIETLEIAINFKAAFTICECFRAKFYRTRKTRI